MTEKSKYYKDFQGNKGKKREIRKIHYLKKLRSM